MPNRGSIAWPKPTLSPMRTGYEPRRAYNHRGLDNACTLRPHRRPRPGTASHARDANVRCSTFSKRQYPVRLVLRGQADDRGRFKAMLEQAQQPGDTRGMDCDYRFDDIAGGYRWLQTVGQAGRRVRGRAAPAGGRLYGQYRRAQRGRGRGGAIRPGAGAWTQRAAERAARPAPHGGGDAPVLPGRRAEPGEHRHHQPRRPRSNTSTRPSCASPATPRGGASARIRASCSRARRPPATYAALWAGPDRGARPGRASSTTGARTAASTSSSPSSRPSASPTARITHYVAVKEDITERKRLGGGARPPPPPPGGTGG